MKRAVVMAERRVIDASDLELAPSSDAVFSLDLRAARLRAEREVLQVALARSNGTLSVAAKLLGISRPTLYGLMEVHGSKSSLVEARRRGCGSGRNQSRHGVRQSSCATDTLSGFCCASGSAWLQRLRMPTRSRMHAAMQEGGFANGADQPEERGALRPAERGGAFLAGQGRLRSRRPVAAETEARAARDRGFDPRQATPLIAQSLLAQKKFKELLRTSTQTARMQASMHRSWSPAGMRRSASRMPKKHRNPSHSPRRPRRTAVEPLLASAGLLAVRGDLNGALAKIDAALNAQPKSPTRCYRRPSCCVPGATRRRR